MKDYSFIFESYYIIHGTISILQRLLGWIRLSGSAPPGSAQANPKSSVRFEHFPRIVIELAHFFLRKTIAGTPFIN